MLPCRKTVATVKQFACLGYLDPQETPKQGPSLPGHAQLEPALLVRPGIEPPTISCDVSHQSIGDRSAANVDQSALNKPFLGLISCRRRVARDLPPTIMHFDMELIDCKFEDILEHFVPRGS